jgi:Tfp pilus assembly protein FimT
MVIKKNRQKGFTIVEVVVILGVIAVILALGGAFSIKASFRRSVDSVATRVANTLQLTKLQAARNGVQFRTRFVQSGNELQLITERGDSNIDSTVWRSNLNSLVSVRLDSSVVISNLPSLFEFRPNGTAAPADGDFDLNDDDNFTVLAASGTDIDRCGKVILSELGRIAAIKGHWDGSDCKQVGDN